jgi:hypothetical protein
MSDLRKLRARRTRFATLFPAMPQEHAAALGRVVSRWTVAEDYCRLIIHCLLDIEGEHGHAVTAEMSFLQRMNTISALTHCLRDHDLLDHWEDICRIADVVRGQRNDMVHAQWQIAGADNILTRIKARGRVTFRLEAIPTEQLAELETAITGLIDDFGWFTQQLARRGFKKAITAGLANPPLDRTQSRNARAQAQGRATKKARRQADRERTKAQPPKR